MLSEGNVIYHTKQRETSHSLPATRPGKRLSMDESQIFKANLQRIMADKGLKMAPLCRAAGLNLRAVKDIVDARSVSPKLSTVFALARALGEDPGEMMGLGPRVKLRKELADYLSQYDEDAQERILSALRTLAPPQPEKP